jgi:hypothetical protein
VAEWSESTAYGGSPEDDDTDDDDVFYLSLQKQKIGAELHIYLEEGTYHRRLFRGPNTNDMNLWDRFSSIA